MEYKSSHTRRCVRILGFCLTEQAVIIWQFYIWQMEKYVFPAGCRWLLIVVVNSIAKVPFTQIVNEHLLNTGCSSATSLWIVDGVCWLSMGKIVWKKRYKVLHWKHPWVCFGFGVSCKLLLMTKAIIRRFGRLVQHLLCNQFHPVIANNLQKPLTKWSGNRLFSLTGGCQGLADCCAVWLRPE